MTCKSCASRNQRKFTSEIAVHFSGLKNLDKPTVFVFPKLLVCIDCGFTEFAISETDLRLLGKDTAPRGTTRSLSVEARVSLSEFFVGSAVSGREIEVGEHAADEPLALKHSLYRQ
jgi:hypothetical protein